MSTLFFGVVAVLLVLVIIVGIPWALFVAPKGAKRGLTDTELSVKATADMRRDALQAVLGVSVLLTFMSSTAGLLQTQDKISADYDVALRTLKQNQDRLDTELEMSKTTTAQNQARMDDERYGRYLADFGSDSPARQTDGITGLMTIWVKEPPENAIERMNVLAAFLETNAKSVLRPNAPSQNVRYGDYLPVKPRSRPNIQAAVWALSELNRSNWKSRSPSSITLKDVDLRELSFQGYCLDGLDFSGCLLGNSDFTKASMQKSFKAHGAFLEEAILSGAHLEAANLKGIHVDGHTDFSDAHVEGLNVDAAESDSTPPKADPAVHGHYHGTPTNFSLPIAQGG